MLLAYEVYLASLGENPETEIQSGDRPRGRVGAAASWRRRWRRSGSVRTRAIRIHFTRSLRRVIARAPLEKRDCNVLPPDLPAD
jgi:tRNA C32,U32 (ribose-2'-O)-methylase TrmJ